MILSPLPANDQRWQATLEYTTDDDGIWLVFGEQRVNLGFWPTVQEVVAGMEELRP